MSPEEIAAKFQAPEGICRFCGRSDEHCVWIDPRRTICSHPDCIQRMGYAGDSAMRRVWNPRCVCGGWKSKKRLFCVGCGDSLPEVLAKMLFEPVERGLGCYVAEAVAFLQRRERPQSPPQGAEIVSHTL
jgi:hypothetical protein